MHSDDKSTQGNNNYYVVAIRYCRYCTNIMKLRNNRL